MSNRLGDRRAIWSWALYDWANSAFATTVIAGFFPLFLKQYWAADLPATTSTFYLGNTVALASLTIMILAPLLGAMADVGGGKKRYLACFMLTGICATAMLALIGQGGWFWALGLYWLAVVGFFGANVFYDALLVDVAPEGRLDRTSALGFGLGYLGGGLLFAVNVLMTLHPDWFGLDDKSQAVRLAFVMVALWWGLFSIPMFMWVKGRQPEPDPLGQAARSGWQQLRETLRDIRDIRPVWMFLLAYWLYIDGVDTIIHMAVDFGAALGFSTDALISALLLTQFIGFPAAIIFGRLGERWGTLKGIYLALGGYVAITIWGFFLQSEAQFYAMAASIGLVQGGIQSLSRAYFARIIPPDKAAEFFGFYNMMGKFAAVIGPLLVGWTAAISGSNRLSILSILILFVLGGLILARAHVEASAKSDT